MKGVGKSEFLDEYASPRCELSGPVHKNQEDGKPIYMMAGWANLIKRREHIEKQHNAITQMAHLRSPTKTCDIHGNTYMSAGKLNKIVFTVKELADGPLLARPKKFGRFEYHSKADFKKGSILVDAMGEEKLFGGIVGPAVCPCQGGLAEANAKGQLIKTWKLGKGLKINSRDFVNNSISHTNDMSTKKISILWRPGDWAMGCFFMQTLPQSSYLQGRGQCLYCAVEGAALAGCPEVIACGGGKVSIEAFEQGRLKAMMEAQRPISMLANVVPGSPTSIGSSSAGDIFTPPPPYSSPPGSPGPPGVDYFAISNANGVKIVPANAVMPTANQVVPEKILRDRMIPSNNITSVGDNTVPTNKTVSSGGKIVRTKRIKSIGKKIAPTNKDEVVATTDLLSFPDQGALEDLISFSDLAALNDLTSLDDKGATDDLISLGDKGTTDDLISLSDKGATDDLMLLAGKGATDDLMLLSDKGATNDLDLMSLGNQGATNHIIPIGDKVISDDLISIGDQVATNHITSTGDKVATDGITPTGDKTATDDTTPAGDKAAIDDITPTGDKAAADNTTPTGDKVATVDTTPASDKVAIDDITPAGDKVAKDDTTPTGDKVKDDITPTGDKVAEDDITSTDDKGATDDVASIGDKAATDDTTSIGDIASITSQRVPSIDIKSFATKIITRKASSSTSKLLSSTSNPEEETATASFDFQVEEEGNLTFKRGDVIRIVKKPEDENEWWTGELNGKQGIFPGELEPRPELQVLAESTLTYDVFLKR